MALRVLLGQLGARGDCLYATAVARQIKHDFPYCHLTWAVGSHCRCLIDGNPDVDEIWEVPVKGHGDMAEAWRRFELEAAQRKQAGEFDRVFLTQIYPDNFGNFDGTVRASIFRGYPQPITVSVRPWLRIEQEESRNVERFAAKHRLAAYRDAILFEYSSQSGQSFVTPELAVEVARKVLARRPNTAMILSSDKKLDHAEPGIIDASVLSFKENAALIRHCSLLVGCSSGISWLCSAATDPPPRTIQLLRRRTSVYASFVHDHEYQGLSTDHIIEMTDCPASRIADAIVAVLDEGIAAARPRFHQRIPLRFTHYGKQLKRALAAGDTGAAWRSARVTIERYGLRPGLLATLLWSCRGYVGNVVRRIRSR